jgi:hypothetical protein
MNVSNAMVGAAVKAVIKGAQIARVEFKRAWVKGGKLAKQQAIKS